MSNYPRTDAARLKDVCRHMAMAAECTRMEYELNAANERIKRLEEACNTLVGLPDTVDWAETLRKSVIQARAALNESKEAKP